jgi:hypothetical protein
MAEARDGGTNLRPFMPIVQKRRVSHEAVRGAFANA